MTQMTHLRPADVRGYSKLAVDATLRVTDLVEAMHLNISRAPWIFGTAEEGRTRGITGLVYRCIREVTGAIGSGLDNALAQLVPLLNGSMAGSVSSPAREAVLAAVNGVLGDHLAASGNPLTQKMEFRSGSKVLTLEPAALRDAIPDVGGKLLVLVHGLCMNDLQWSREGYSHADALAQNLGYSAVSLRYNSGRNISLNGREFADQLEALLIAWPVPLSELTLLTHSMGGLVSRSACHYAAQSDHTWLRKLSNIVFLGTPNHGAPLERGGNVLQTAAGITPYTAPLARLGMIRSAGVTDLRYGYLLDEDWNSRDRFEPVPDLRRHLPLPSKVNCYAAAATTGARRGDLNDKLFGDGLVPVASALGEHCETARCLNFAPERQALFFNTSHWGLLYNRSVGQQIREWLAH
jgi:hypothetical protein